MRSYIQSTAPFLIQGPIFSQTVPLTIADTTKLSAKMGLICKINIVGKTELLTDFIVYVRLSDLPDKLWQIGDETLSNIGIYDENHNALPLQIVGLETLSKTGILYFKCDISANTLNTFSVELSNSNPSASNVWSSYKYVNHTSLSMTDDSSVGAEILATDVVNETSDIALINSKTFNGSTSFARSTINNGITNAALRTISYWAKITTLSSAKYHFAIGTHDGTSRLCAVGTNGTAWYFHGYGNDHTGGTAVTGVWMYHQIVYNGSQILWYQDGSLAQTFSVGSLLTVNTPVLIGARPNTADYSSPTGFFAGLLEEVRLASLARSSVWAAAEYQNFATPLNFYSIS